MCTVTIVSMRGMENAESRQSEIADSGVRLVCNRDELRTRLAARPPVERVFGVRRAIMPVDPVSDGTWIAANDAGLIMTLLNTYLGDDRGTEARWSTSRGSRGEIIPSLVKIATIEQTFEAAAAIDASRYPPFRLLMLDARLVGEVAGDGRNIRVGRLTPIDRPLLYTSSGLGDAIVESPRRELFDDYFSGDADWIARQDAFHVHHWPDRPHLSVLMSRAEARTVSRTTVEMQADAIVMKYVALTEDHAAEPVTVRLARSGVAA